MDYIIIGGGISGITIANKLNSENKILLLEKENRLGGRIYTYNNIEFGAKWIHRNIPKFPLLKNIQYFYEKQNKYIQNYNVIDHYVPYELLSKFYQNKKLTNQELEDLNIILGEDYGTNIKKLHKSNYVFNEYNGKHKRVINGFNNIFKPLVTFKYKLNYTVTKITKQNEYFIINDKYKTKNLIFAVPLNIVKNYFNYLLTNNQKITLNKISNSKIKIFAIKFNKIFWNTDNTYWFSKENPTIVIINGLNNILYVKEYETNFVNKNNILDYISKYMKYNIKKYKKLYYKEWNEGYSYYIDNITKNEIKKFNEKNNIYFIGEYLAYDRIGTIDGAYKTAIDFFYQNYK
jgi:protoporphyrinogen oxidase